jgi:prepilin-type N-terminal cleavage/methylation domain-containing protein
MLLKVKYNRLTGFTLVELLISLVIVGLLLSAVAVVLNASVINYRENEEIFRSINEARQALTRMTNQIRTGLVDSNNVANEQVCKICCSDDSIVEYHYDSINHRLYLYDYDTGSDYLLCDNVSSATFKKDNNTTSGDIKSVRISITISDGQITQNLAAAAVVRRALEH